MLSLKNIVKEYPAGGSKVVALDGVSIDFRRNEFVSILGPSGCGKTTLLNIIGGLDQYTRGELEINGISTKRYTEKDWDTYRNHSIGFVFQSYNLIPHQTVLANVELALTLSGVSKAERRRRAKDALRQVGLESQMNKKPNQMSGGQMQRVAIARALVNDPEILLADEPTGALDTQTSEQIMEILRSISEKKLIIMVTHNPDLANRYSTRIIRLLDGKVVGDTAPVRLVRREKAARRPHKGKRSMSFFTALSLSLNNLMTKKGRTFMTSFAGSIGIIGIALILSVSSGVNNYINSVQRDTLASYPIQLEAETADFSSLVTTLMGADSGDEKATHELDRVYESSIIVDLMNSLNSIETNKNDLASFKSYMKSHKEQFDPFVSAVQYGYDFNWRILTTDTTGAVIKSDVGDLINAMYGGSSGSMMGGSSMMMSSRSYRIWQELLEGSNGETVNSLIKGQYDLIYGSWPEQYNEILLVVNERNEISDLSLYALGLRTQDEIMKTMLAATNGEMIDTSTIRSYSYEEICAMSFKMLLASDCYQKKANGTYEDMSATAEGRQYLYNGGSGVNLKVVGIIRPNPDATSTLLNGTVAYTAKLSRYALEQTEQSELLRTQLADEKTDVLTGLPFRTTSADPTDAEKISVAKDYLASLSTLRRAQVYRDILATPTEEEVNSAMEAQFAGKTEEELTQMLLQAIQQQYGISAEDASGYLAMIPAEARMQLLQEGTKQLLAEQIRLSKQEALDQFTDEQILSQELTDEQYLIVYAGMPAQFSESTYNDNLTALGYVKEDSPRSIALFAETFEKKDEISQLIKDYNKSVDEEKQITYTDYVALLMSSVTTIVNAISYVLIAFVAISLVVSSIMIGIITYISVLERTKEIGILRSIGASRRDIGHVFNAETLIVGFVAGLIGIVSTILLNQVINIILYHFTGIASLRAVLPIGGAVVLVAISMFLTFIAGLVPSGFAARKNPVEALRTE